MKLLAIDCSTEACSVALLTERGTVAEQFELAARQHTQRLLPMVDSVLAQTQVSLNQLDAIAFGRGPGSFTGLRICLGAVQGLAFGADLPVVPVSTLAALAQTALVGGAFDDAITRQSSFRMVSMLDARMDEIYWAIYRMSGDWVEIEGQEQLSAPELLSLTDTDDENATFTAIGSGWNYANRIPCRARFSDAVSNVLPKASAVAMLAEREVSQGRLYRAEEALPSYLRDEVAWKKQPL